MLPSEPPRSRISLRRPAILLVDDDPGVIRGLCRILRRCRPDFQVYTAFSAARALEALAGHSYDVVVTDLQMPGGGGRSVLKTLSEFHPETARIVHSSQRESSETTELHRLSHVVLAKPATESEIVAAIELALSRARAERSPARSG